MVVPVRSRTTAPSRSPAPSPRDPGLDLLRAGVLLLMVFVHVFRFADHSISGVTTLLWFGEAAPALFFFAFGMTTRAFLDREPTRRSARLLAFLYVALMHNAVTGTLGRWNFLGFLFMARGVTWALAGAARAPARWHLAAFGVFGLCLLFTPVDWMGSLFRRAVPGPFPLVPWILFVLAGHAYAGGALGRRGLLAALGAVAFAAILWSLSELGGIDSYRISKWPLTFPFVLAGCGGAVLIVEGGRTWARLGHRQPTGVDRLSRNLLLGTALHYLPLALFTTLAVWSPIRTLGPGLRTVVVGGFTILSMASIRPLIAGTRRLWSGIEGRAGPRLLLAHPHSVAVVLLLLVGVPMSLYETVRLANLWGTDWPRLLRLLPFLSLVWLSLAMGQRLPATDGEGSGSAGA